MCDTYNCDYLKHITLRLNLIDFQLSSDFRFPILRFLPQNHLASLKDRFLKKMLIKRANPSPFLHKTIGLDNSFTLIENNFRFLR